MQHDTWMMELADPWFADGTGDQLPPVGPLRDQLVELLRGHPQTAAELALRAYDEAVSVGDGAQAVLALDMRWLARTRSLNFFPGGSGARSPELTTRWDQRQELSALEELKKRARGLGGTREVRALSAWLTLLALIPVRMASIRDSSSSPHREMIVRTFVDSYDHEMAAVAELSPLAKPFVHRRVAELLAAAGDVATARVRLARARAGFEAGSSHEGIASCLALEADWALTPHGSALMRNLELSESFGPTSELPWAIEAREGDVEGADLVRARARLGEALDHCRAGTARGATVQVRIRQAHLCRRLGDRAGQRAMLEDARRLSEEIGDAYRSHLVAVLGALERVEAGALPEESDLTAVCNWGTTTGSSSYAIGLGLLCTRAGRQALIRAGDYETAVSCLRLALTLNAGLRAPRLVSRSHADLAAVHEALGNRARAHTHHARMLEALPPDESASRAAARAPRAYLEALAHRDVQGMKRALEQLKSGARAGADLETMAALMMRPSMESQASVLIPLYEGMDRRKRGDVEGANERFAQADRHAAELPGAQGQFLRAIVLATRGGESDRSDAVALFDQSMASGGHSNGLVEQLLVTLEQTGAEPASRERANAARRALEQEFSFMVRVEHYARASRAADALVRIAGPQWWNRVDGKPWVELSELGELYEGLEDYEQAVESYEQAIEQLERRRRHLSRDELKTALSADHGVQFMYFQAVRAALRRAERLTGQARRAVLARAFEFSERARARGLLDLLATGHHEGDDTTERGDDLRRWRYLNARTQLWNGLLVQAGEQPERQIGLRDKLERSERELAAHTRAMLERDPSIERLVRADACIASLEEVSRALSDSAAVLQFMTLGDELLIWAITRAGLVEPTIVPTKAEVLAEHVRRVHQGCAKELPLEDSLMWLSTTLLEPVARVIEEHERLVIVPYGELHRLPFAALIWADDWLGAQRTLSVLPSASMMLQLPRCSPPPPRSVLSVGDPRDMSHVPPFEARAALPPLPYAKEEARRVAALYGADPLIGDEATLAAVSARLGDTPLIALATHGMLYEEAPLLSGVALANGELLTVSALLGIQLDADLVVLSACRTGVGEHIGGEEIIGLTRGLLAAGARSAVVSLWPVEDPSTATLMAHFHEKMVEGIDPPTALRLAQQELRDQLDPRDPVPVREGVVTPSSPVLGGSHPLRWAPFVYVGAVIGPPATTRS